MLKQSRTNQTLDSASGRGDFRKVGAAGDSGLRRPQPSPRQTCRTRAESVLQNVPPPPQSYTHLEALGHQRTHHNTQSSHTSAQEEIHTEHIPHNAVAQKVTAHTTQIVTHAASHRDMTHTDTCSAMIVTPLKYRRIDPQYKDMSARPALETAQLKGYHPRLTHQPQKSPKSCICNTQRVCRNQC